MAIERARSSLQVGVVVALAAALVGAIAVASPGLLHLDQDLTAHGLLALCGGLATGALVLWRPDLGLLLLTAFVCLNLSQVLVRYHRLPSLLQLLAFPLLLGIVAHRRTPALKRVVDSVATRWLVAYGLVILFSTTLARDAALADERLAETGKSVAIYLLVATLASSAALVRRAAWSLLACGALLGSLGVAQIATGDFQNDFGGLARVKYAQIYGDVFEPRIAGPLGDPNFYAQALVLLVPLGLSLAMSERAAHRKAIALAGTGLVVGAAALTYSRGGALALAVVLALSLLAWPLSRRRAALATGLVAVLVALLVPAGFARRLTTLEQVWPGREAVLRPDSSLEKRRLLVGAAWRMFLDHPLAGVGAGNYTVHFESYADEVGGMARDYEEPDERHYPHSLYLEIAAETGLVGLVAFGGVIAAGVVSLRRAREAFRRAGDERTAALVQGFAIALFGYLVSSLFLHGHYQRYLWLLLGFASALDALASARAPSDEQDAAAP